MKYVPVLRSRSLHWLCPKRIFISKRCTSYLFNTTICFKCSLNGTNASYCPENYLTVFICYCIQPMDKKRKQIKYLGSPGILWCLGRNYCVFITCKKQSLLEFCSNTFIIRYTGCIPVRQIEANAFPIENHTTTSLHLRKWKCTIGKVMQLHNLVQISL